MKQSLNIICLIFQLLLTYNIVAAEENQSSDKSHLTFGVIPVFSYDADLGLKYGAVLNLFDSKYSDYPNYDQYLNLKLSHTTRNTLNLQALFESSTLFPNATTFLEATYTNDQKLDFFGFNGIETIVNADWRNPSHSNFRNKNFYSIDRKLIRLRADVQKNLIDNKLRFLTGITFNNVMFNFPEEENANNTLYQNYIDWGLINKNEKNGGLSTYAKLGLIYDTRNDNLYCTKGNWIEGFLVYAPSFINEQAYSKLVLTYRAYQSFKNEKYTLSVRLSSQNKLSGKIPSYMLPFYFDTQINQDGLGGAYTLRGVTRNRIVSDGFAMGNFESRIQLKELRLLKLDFEISSTLFLDLAYITQRRKVVLSNVPNKLKAEFFSTSPQQLYSSFGPGINITFNHNNITTVNYGFSSNKQLGSGGLYIGSRFLF